MRKSVWFLTAVVAAAVLYTGLWYAAATTVRTLALQWLDDRRREGLIITHDAPTLTGFPLRSEVKIPNLVVAAPALANSPAWTWGMDDLRAFARPFMFNRMFLNLAGTHTLAGVLADEVQADVKRAEIMMTTRGDRAELMLGGITAGAFALDKASIKSTFGPDAIHAEIAVDNATLPGVVPPPLSRTLQSLTLTLDITGHTATGARVPVLLERWRTDGGAVEVRDLDITWPPVSATGSGTVALDRDLQPEGAFTATFTGFMDVVDMLVAGGRMDNQQASMARGALMLLSKTPNDGSPPYLDLSLTVQDRKVTAGPVMLMEMPLFTWRQNIIVP